jgi:hypothetical protein
VLAAHWAQPAMPLLKCNAFELCTRREARRTTWCWCARQGRSISSKPKLQIHMATKGRHSLHSTGAPPRKHEVSPCYGKLWPSPGALGRNVHTAIKRTLAYPLRRCVRTCRSFGPRPFPKRRRTPNRDTGCGAQTSTGYKTQHSRSPHLHWHL